MSSQPHNGSQLQEKLDIILTAAAFEQQLALLFLDEGVFQLKNGQQPKKQGLKDTSLIFNALEVYDVQELYIEIESLQERGINSRGLSLPVKPLYRKEVNSFMKKYDIILSG